MMLSVFLFFLCDDFRVMDLKFLLHYSPEMKIICRHVLKGFSVCLHVCVFQFYMHARHLALSRAFPEQYKTDTLAPPLVSCTSTSPVQSASHRCLIEYQSDIRLERIFYLTLDLFRIERSCRLRLVCARCADVCDVFTHITLYVITLHRFR